jgi:hypothetical protein
MIAYDRLSQIVPSDQALAAKALATSLQQISGITNMTLPVLANTTVNLQTTNNLSQISALTQAVPSSVANYLKNLAGTNGAPVGICDVLGIAAGYRVADDFLNTVATLANTNVTYLTTVYQTMNSVVGNVYGDPVNGPVIIPVGQPAAGTYYANIGNVGNVANIVITTAADNAFTAGAGSDGTGNVLPATGPGLLPVATNAIANIATTSSAQVAALNSYFNSMADQVVQEKNLQATAQIDFANLIPNNNPIVYSLINSLPSYGRQTEQGGMAQFWEGVADISTFTGQALVAVLREGQNQALLGNAGVQTNALVPDAPNPPIPPANLIPSTYTAQQAANLIVR